MDTLLTAAAHVSGIWSLAAFAIAALVGYLASHRGKVPVIAWGVVVGVILLGLAPIAGSYYVQIKTANPLYRLRVNVVDPDGQPVEEAVVQNSLGNFATKAAGAWQFEIPTTTRPANGKLTVYATIESAFRSGHADVMLGDDRYPALTVTVRSNDRATIRGIVQDVHGRAIPGVQVSVVGYAGEAVATGLDGGFLLPAHAADGQQVQLHAEKAGLGALTEWDQAGPTPVTLTLRHE